MTDILRYFGIFDGYFRQHSRDRRVATVNETLSAIKLVKSNAWQSSFKERITKSREEELGPLFKFQVVMMMFGIQVILPPAPGVSNEGGISPLLGPLPAVFRPWVPAWGSLEPLVETVKTRKKRGKAGGKWARYGLRSVREGS